MFRRYCRFCSLYVRSQFLPAPLLFRLKFGVMRLMPNGIGLDRYAWCLGLRLERLVMISREMIFQEFQPIWPRYQAPQRYRQTDRQTDRQTTCHVNNALCESRGKKPMIGLCRREPAGWAYSWQLAAYLERQEGRQTRRLSSTGGISTLTSSLPDKCRKRTSKSATPNRRRIKVGLVTNQFTLTHARRSESQSLLNGESS